MSTNRICVLLLSMALLAAAAAVAEAPRDESGLPLWEAAVFHGRPVRLTAADQADLRQLLAAVPVADFHREQVRPGPDGTLTVRVRVTDEELAALRSLGRTVTELPDREQAGRRAVERAWAERYAAAPEKAWSADKSTYPTQADIAALFNQLATDHSALCDTFIWGQSVQGRDLLGLRISHDVQNTAPEPEVRLSASIHGDETVGMVMLVRLAEELVTKYGEPGFEDVTALVDGTEIHIMPLHNPDGYALGIRQNANFKDLNRNFGPPAGTLLPVEIENVHFQNYALAHDFVISQNGHGGALVVNYPWDYTFELTPDDAAIQLLSLEYSTHNLPMYNGAWPLGITNGAEWYVANGTLQDWSYDQTGCIDLTMELSDIKWPPAAQLDQFWLENRESLLHFVASARYGINGVVTDAYTGDPLAATITLAGNAQPVHTDPEHGDYYKLVAGGTFDVTFSADGYRDSTVTGVTAAWGTATVLDVGLNSLTSPVPVAPRPHLALRADPNPFNPRTVFTVTVPRDGPAILDIHDLRGRRVARLIDGTLAAGEHPVAWDGQGGGLPLPGGVYLARLVTPAGTATHKVVLAK